MLDHETCLVLKKVWCRVEKELLRKNSMCLKLGQLGNFHVFISDLRRGREGASSSDIATASAESTVTAPVLSLTMHWLDIEVLHLSSMSIYVLPSECLLKV